MSKPTPEKIKHLFANSVAKLQRGDATGATRGFEKLAKAIPEHAVVWYNLGLGYQHLNRHAKAVDAYQRALRLNGAQVDAAVNLGLSQKELRQSEQAMQSAVAALNLAPEHPRALNLLGTLHAEQNAHELAGAAFRRALTNDPQNEDARHNLANSMLQSGDAETARQIVQPLLVTKNAADHAALAPPSQKRHRVLYGQILLDLKRYGEASEVVRELTAQFKDDEAVMLLEMSLYERARDYFSVLEVANALLKRPPSKTMNVARVWNSLGSAYFQLDSVGKAADCYDQAIARQPQHAEYHNNRGLAHSSWGEKEAAERCYRKAIALSSGYAEAYRNLVALKKFLDWDEDAQAIQKLWEMEGLDDFTRTKLAFALGKVYDDVGEYPQAFATYEIGNRLQFAEASMDFDRYFAHIDAVPQIFTAPPTSSASARKTATDSDSEPMPIFIVGMPRSGTTLVEQILSRHAAVSGCGELPCIEKSIARLERRAEPMRKYPWDFLKIGGQTLCEERRGYIAWVKRLHDLETDFFTDKMPFNFVHLWLIKALFPDASIVHCHRHPLDVILSNYFQLYASDVSFVYDLPVLAKYYVRYYRLMRHWRGVFGEQIYKVQYEALVGDKEAQTRQLIQAVNLPWDAACLDLKKSATAVRTASIWQVRQGIYTTSRERWRNYQAQLGPAIEILQAENILDADLHEAA